MIDNALRHTPAGGTITIAAQRDPNDRHKVLIEIRDTGDGIAPADLPHVFDRFYRANHARTHDSSQNAKAGANQIGNGIGSGLGLSIAQRLVELHHGLISVSSSLGQGAVFRIELPVAA